MQVEMRQVCVVTSRWRTSNFCAPSVETVSGSFIYHNVANRNEADPLFAFEFMRAFLDILSEYFGAVTAGAMRDNFDIVYQV